MLVTPLQLANIYATFANGGTVYQPNIVTKVVRYGGDLNSPEDVLRTIEPVVKGKVDLPPNVHDPILAGPRRRAPLGHRCHAPSPASTSTPSPSPARPARPRSTARPTPRSSPPSVPSADPAYATAAVLEESGFGADAAAPVVRHIFETDLGPERVGRRRHRQRQRRLMTLTRSFGPVPAPIAAAATSRRPGATSTRCSSCARWPSPASAC